MYFTHTFCQTAHTFYKIHLYLHINSYKYTHTSGLVCKHSNFMYASVYTYMHTYIRSASFIGKQQRRKHTHIHRYACIHTIHTYIHTCMHTYIRSASFMGHLQRRKHIHIHRYACIHTIHTYMHAYIHTYSSTPWKQATVKAYTHTQMYIHTYIHTYIKSSTPLKPTAAKAHAHTHTHNDLDCKDQYASEPLPIHRADHHGP